MSKRRTHSSIDRLPAELKATITRMLIDREWPFDFNGPQEGHPRYQDIVDYCHQSGSPISASAVGRWAKKLRVMESLKNRSLIVAEAMKQSDEHNIGEIQKATCDLLNARLIDLIVSDDNLTPKQIAELARATKDNNRTIIDAHKYITDQIQKKAQKAAASTKKKLTAAGVDRKLIQEIMDEHLGVTKS